MKPWEVDEETRARVLQAVHRGRRSQGYIDGRRYLIDNFAEGTWLVYDKESKVEYRATRTADGWYVEKF